MLLGVLSTGSGRPPTSFRRSLCSAGPATHRSSGTRTPGPVSRELTSPTFITIATDGLTTTCRTAFNTTSVVVNTTGKDTAVPAGKCDLAPKAERSVRWLGAPGDCRVELPGDEKQIGAAARSFEHLCVAEPTSGHGLAPLGERRTMVASGCDSLGTGRASVAALHPRASIGPWISPS